MAEICVKLSEISLKKHCRGWRLVKLIKLSVYLGYYLTFHKKITVNKLPKKDNWDYQQYVNYYENNLAHLTGAEKF